MKTQLLIPAAGTGSRLGAEVPKALVPVAGIPLIVRTLRKFDSAGLIDNPVIAVTPGQENTFNTTLHEHFPDANFTLVPGGAERQDSVRLALDALNAETDIVAIHDAARPFIAPETILEAVKAAAEHGAATVAEPCADTILQADDDGFLESTPDRARLWACLTPQVFRVDIVKQAHQRAVSEGTRYTDDGTMVRAMDQPVKIVACRGTNRKITTVDDLRYAEYLLEKDHA